MSEHLWWYVARSGGIVSWALLAASVLWGLALSTRALGARPRPNWLLDLHRFLGGLALVFVGVHVGALVLDSYLSFGLMQLFVPFTSSYRPGAVAWGVVGLYLLLAVEVTSLLRRRIPKPIWRRVHLASFGLFAVATLHGLLAGTDGGSSTLRWVMLVTTATVVALTALRVAQALEPAPARPAPARPARPGVARRLIDHSEVANGSR
jgi:predicted ferric reductase